MITNIILGLILVVILVVFFILNNRYNQISEYQRTIKKDLDYIINHLESNDELLEDIRDRFINFILDYKSNNTTIKDTLTQINNCTNTIYDKVIRIKSAKISSKNESYSKTNKSTNK